MKKHFMALRSVWTANRGPSVGWGRQERKATVNTNDALKS